MTKQQPAGTPLKSLPIPGFPGWSVSTDGSVTHRATGTLVYIRRVPGSRNSNVGISEELSAAAALVLNSWTTPQ